MCNVWPSWWKFVYMSIVLALSQIAAPIILISHLVIISEMARTQKDRNQLSSLKNSAQFVANIITFIIIYFILGSDRASENEETSPHDAYRFRVSILTMRSQIIRKVMNVNFLIAEHIIDYDINWHFNGRYFPLITKVW